MAQQAYPELVAQRSHRPGSEDARTFEDTLRELLRSSPYLVVSVVVHALLLALFSGGRAPPPPPEPPVIKAEAEKPVEIIPPEPELRPPEPEQLIEKFTDDPVVSEVPYTGELAGESDSDVISHALMDSVRGDNETRGSTDIIGVGGGGLAGGSGKFGRRGGGGGPGAGTPFNKAVDDALDWLKNHQNADGFWSCAGFASQCGKQGNDTRCDGPGSEQFDTGVTALALLAFLGHGDTHKSGTYRTTVRNGLKYLVDVQQADGNFGDEAVFQYTYDHIIATLAMVEAYALTRDNLFRKPAAKGLEYMYTIRNKDGAWRYSKHSPEMITRPNDMSVTGWAIMVMTSAKDCGLPLDKLALEDAFLFLEDMTDPVTGVTGYFDRGTQPPRLPGLEATWPNELTESMTAVGVLCRIFGDPELKRPGNVDLVNRGIDILTRLPPLWANDAPGRRDFYYWYYGTYALYQCNTPALPKGKQAWKSWEDTLLPNIAEHQHRDGERKGSWDPQHDPWGGEGGRVYSTAILCLTMEVYYRYATVVGAH